MIVLAEEKGDQEKLLALCEKTAFGCKIASVAGCYGFDKGFACFWLDTTSQAVYCLVDGVMLLSGTVLDGEEALAFLRAVGPEQVFCAVRNAEALGLRPQAAGDVLRRQVPAGEALQPPGGVNIRELYGLLEETGMVEEFEPFYLDLSHKLRHGGAVALTRHQEGELAGCAVVSAISRKAAVLSAVAVGERFRRQGMGSALVRQVEACLPGKNVYVFREKEKNQAFYRKLGYSKIDTWVQARL